MASFSALLKEEKNSISKETDGAYKGEVEKYGKATDGLYLKDRED